MPSNLRNIQRSTSITPHRQGNKGSIILKGVFLSVFLCVCVCVCVFVCVSHFGCSPKIGPDILHETNEYIK